MFACGHDHASEHSADHIDTHVAGHGHDANAHMNKTSFETLVERFEGNERAQWQRPDDVINSMGDLNGKTVMDIGAGTGYFSFRIAEKGASVIAADVDDRFLGYIQQKIESNDLANVRTKKVEYDDPLMEPESVDEVIIVNTYHHIHDRVDYFRKVREGLVDGGNLTVVDFKAQETAHGPSVNHRLSASVVQEELTQAGFSNIAIDTTLLPEQYIIKASE